VGWTVKRFDIMGSLLFLGRRAGGYNNRAKMTLRKTEYVGLKMSIKMATTIALVGTIGFVGLSVLLDLSGLWIEVGNWADAGKPMPLERYLWRGAYLIQNLMLGVPLAVFLGALSRKQSGSSNE
jgi:hypothetical protein